jgi:hypothetical protein
MKGLIVSDPNIIRDIREAPFAWLAKHKIRLIREHFDSSNQLATALSVYLVLTEIASNKVEERFVASYAYIASMVGVSRRTTIRIMAQLEKIELISIEERIEGKRNLPNMISLLGGDSVTPVTSMKIGKLSPNRINKEETIEQNKETMVRFEQLWKQYPKKKSKKVALKAFHKINPDDVLFSIMLTALEAQRQTDDWTKDRGQFIPLLATWLNQARWEDEELDNQLPIDPDKWNPL